jgi:Uma2 family endonuclease
MAVQHKATLVDLYKEPGKAELVNGKVVRLMPTGGDPGYAADEIFVALREYAKRLGRGRAVSDNKGFRVNLPGRESFSPDAAFYIGQNPGMKFYEGAPVFAVEVRSESDYGKEAELAMAQKRADYFAAGTKVVWDVDLLNNDVITSYSFDKPFAPRVFRRGDVATAEPALSDWQFAVNQLFSDDL